MGVDTLKAGPELDALVAQAIGIVHVQLDLSHPDGRFGTAIDPLPYSTDWNAAMEALKSLIEGSDWRIGGYEVCWPDMLTEDRSVHEVRIGPWSLNTPGKKDGPLAMAHAPTGPLAICRAILQAKEADRERA